MPDPLDPTDKVLARKFGEIAPPAGLRARLLAIEAGPVRAGNWWARGLAVAATVAVAAMALFLFLPASSKVQPLADATGDMARFLTSAFPLEMETSESQKIKDWIAQRHPNRPLSLPQALTQNRPLGCRDLLWRGHVGSLVCFAMKNGREAHLVMFPEKTFMNAPGGKPQIARAGEWTTAAWSKDGMTYILFVPAGMDPMKELAASRAQRNSASSNVRSVAWAGAKKSFGVERIVSASCT